MGSSLIVISLALVTLLIGLAIAIHQLWSADKAKQEGEHSALAHRFSGRPAGKPMTESIPKEPASPDPRI